MYFLTSIIYRLASIYHLIIFYLSSNYNLSIYHLIIIYLSSNNLSSTICHLLLYTICHLLLSSIHHLPIIYLSSMYFLTTIIYHLIIIYLSSTCHLTIIYLPSTIPIVYHLITSIYHLS